MRTQVPLLTDSLILREMAEELQREPRGGGERVRAPGLIKQWSEELGIEETQEEHHSFHSVLK